MGKPKSDKECKRIGIGMVHRRIFHSAFIPTEQQVDLMPKVFLPLSFMNKEQLVEYEKNNYVALYESFDEGFPKGINGYPMFMSCVGLTKEENDKVIKEYNAELNRMRELLDDDSETEESGATASTGSSNDGAGG